MRKLLKGKLAAHAKLQTHPSIQHLPVLQLPSAKTQKEPDNDNLEAPSLMTNFRQSP
jgi:hypothetical protein